MGTVPPVMKLGGPCVRAFASLSVDNLSLLHDMQNIDEICNCINLHLLELLIEHFCLEHDINGGFVTTLGPPI